MKAIAIVVVTLASLLGSASPPAWGGLRVLEEPRRLKDFAVSGEGYVQIAEPGSKPLLRADIVEALKALNASPAQTSAALLLYDDWALDQYNPMMSREAPKYLEAARAAARAHELHGIRSREFDAAWRTLFQRTVSLSGLAAQAEINLIDSLSVLLDDAQADGLEPLRELVRRRKARSIPTTDRWVLFDARRAWALPTDLRLEANERAEVEAVILAHVADLERRQTSLLESWYSAQLDAARRVQRFLVGESADASTAWHRSARVSEQLREITVACNEDILKRLPAAISARLRRSVDQHLFPELKVPKSCMETRQELETLLEKTDLDAPVRETVIRLIVALDAQTTALRNRMIAAIVDFDGQVALGTGEARPQQLPEILAPMLADQDALCRDFATRIDRDLGDAMAGQPRKEDASRPPQAATVP
jgi:hypothetical protein